ncbi:protein abrupt-like [Uloborus diversus]|uniref:protein abrupt-like n=1 Tax=Uloborus diversus TaxID=327109 RepID=UPI002409C7C3|nr:protein abrupt-like [Uloborus diversus]XP_054718004.1 protein abrupt-like [Uloborus diversus]
MSQKEVCLKWENHPINLLSSFKSFQSSNVLVDVTLSCEGHSLKAHKLVLSACSPYFQSLFTENPCQHPIVFMSDMRFEIMKAIMDFIYNGEVNVAHDELSAFLKAAEALKVKKLSEVCAQSLNSRIDSNASYSQRVSTPMKKRNRGRKRSLSDSNKSDEEIGSIKQEPLSPESQEIHEISGDEFYTSSEMKSNDGLRLNSHVPMNAYSSSHRQSAGCIIREPDSDEEYEMESSKLLEQTLAGNMPSNNQGNHGLSMSSDGLRIEKKMRSTPDTQPSNMQGTLENPEDVKPIIQFEDSEEEAEGTMMSYNEQSQPGPSNYKESSLAQQEGSQPHGTIMLVFTSLLL